MRPQVSNALDAWAAVALAVILTLVVGCGPSIPRPRPIEMVKQMIPVAVQCPDPGPREAVTLEPVAFLAPDHAGAVVGLSWAGLKALMANVAALKAALEAAEAKLDGYRRPAKKEAP